MPANPKYNKVAGFGLFGIIILVAIIASATFGGGMYLKEMQNQKSTLQMGMDAQKRAEELKKQIESRQESIYGGRTSINVDTSDWKTYRNEKYGFEVRYASDYRIFESVSVPEELWSYVDAIQVSSGSAGFSIFMFPKRSEGVQRITQYFDDRRQATPEAAVKAEGPSWWCREESIKNYSVTDFQNLRCGGESEPTYETFGRQGSRYVLITSFPTTEVKTFLSTFKFIESIDTSTWKTYRNEKYGFEVKYPPKWSERENLIGDFGVLFQASISGQKFYEFTIIVVSRDREDYLNLSKRFSKVQERSIDNIVCEVSPEMFNYDQTTYFILCRKNNFIYSVGFPNGEKNKENPNIVNSITNAKIAEQILTTFKFIK